MHDNGGWNVDRNQADGGWDYEFLVAPPDEYICSICLKTLRDPKQIANCGHRFCAVCLSPVLRYRTWFLYSKQFCIILYIERIV